MKLARRACLERDISRCAYFISRYVIGTSKNARLRARRGKDLNAAAPRARPRAGTHARDSTTTMNRVRDHADRTRRAVRQGRGKG